MIDYKSTVGATAVIAVIAGFVLHSPSPTTVPKPGIEPLPLFHRCTGVSGTETSGTVSVHEYGIAGCWIAFHKPFDHDPTCTVEVLGAIDADHHFAKGQLPVLAARDRLTMPTAQERMLLHYTCQ